MKILMATDGSKEATIALRSAIRLLKTADLQVELLCVMPSFPIASSPPGLRQFREAYARRIGLQTQRILERDRATLCAEGVEAQLVSKTESPARVIADMAEDYDLTVIGARGTRCSPAQRPRSGRQPCRNSYFRGSVHRPANACRPGTSHPCDARWLGRLIGGARSPHFAV